MSSRFRVGDYVECITTRFGTQQLGKRGWILEIVPVDYPDHLNIRVKYEIPFDYLETNGYAEGDLMMVAPTARVKKGFGAFLDKHAL